MTSRGRPPLVPLILIALLGGALGFFAGRGGAGQPLHSEPSGIEAPFVELAGGPVPETPGGIGPLSAPLYVLLLEGLGIRQPGGVPAVRLRQALLLGVVLPLLTMTAAAAAFGAAAALPAGLLALLPGALWLEISMLTPFGWQALCALLALIALIRLPPRAAPLALRCAVAAVALVLARLLGAAWAPAMALVTGLWLLLRGRWSGLAAFVAAALLIVVLPGFLNEGRAKPIATDPFGLGGADAWAGFHTGATGIDPRRGESGLWRWQTLRDQGLELERRLKRRVTPQDVIAEGYTEARRWALAHPLEAVRLAGWKAFLSVSGYDPPAPESLAFRARTLLPWSRPLLPLAALVTGLGCVGLWMTVRRRRTAGAGGTPPDPAVPDAAERATNPAIMEPAPFLLLLLAVASASALSIARAGDRLPLLVALAAPAAWALLSIRDAWARGSTRARVSMTLAPAAVIALLATPWWTLAPRAETPSEDLFLLASLKARAGASAEATARLESALRADPHHAGARMALASALAQDGLFDEALTEITQVTEELPPLSAAWRFRALLHQQKGQYQEALAAYETLTTLDPLNPEYWNNLGTLHVTLGAYEPAVAALRMSLTVDSTYVTARRNLEEILRRGPEGIRGGVPSTGAPADGMRQIEQGVAAVMQALQSGNSAEAERIVAQLRQAFGSTPDVDFATATVHLQKGELAPAIELYERCRAAMPGNPVLLNNLAAAYARSGQLARSIPLWEEVLRADPTNQMVRSNIEAARRELSGG